MSSPIPENHQKNTYYCYMVCCSNGAFYTGWTTDPLRRLTQHNAGRGARYTRMHSPVKLVYIERVEDHIAALKREAQIKKLTHARKAALITANPLPDEFQQP